MTDATSYDYYSPGAYSRGFAIQSRVIGALILREMHTRFGRDNIGYLWLIAEPMLLASVIALIHIAQHTQYSSGIPAVPLAVVGYTVFIMFRNIVNRSEGAMESNAPLLYHKMVMVEDVVLSRAILEAGGTVTNVIVMLTLMITVGLADYPARPLYFVMAIAFEFWFSWSQSMIVVAVSHDNRTVGRLIHIYTYFMIPLSGAFFQLEWLPKSYRDGLLWSPMPHIFEMVRYGQFQSASDKYFDILYLTGWCMGLTLIGLLSLRTLRRRMHLN